MRTQACVGLEITMSTTTAMVTTFSPIGICAPLRRPAFLLAVSSSRQRLGHLRSFKLAITMLHVLICRRPPSSSGCFLQVSVELNVAARPDDWPSLADDPGAYQPVQTFIFQEDFNDRQTIGSRLPHIELLAGQPQQPC
ncbi:hypothetical protein K474DRAFT_1664747 [Panus rudis PR-1116 ss-1]|nr:hypothetical protein K474DRAFT_1664747 [Panus rudis PR-1116 ss-1]